MGLRRFEGRGERPGVTITPHPLEDDRKALHKAHHQMQVGRGASE